MLRCLRGALRNGVHVCFFAPSHDAVDAVQVTGLAAGDVDQGTPGPKPDCGPTQCDVTMDLSTYVKNYLYDYAIKNL